VQCTFKWRIAEQFRLHRWRPQFILSDLKLREIGEVRLCHAVKLFEDIKWNEAPEALTRLTSWNDVRGNLLDCLGVLDQPSCTD